MYWGTPILQFLPWRALALDALKGGELPLWNPLVGMGAPLVANYQSAFFYPPNWLYIPFGWIGGTAAMAWLQGVLIAFHLAFSGWGMARLVRKLGMGVLAQTVGGLAFGLSGYLVARAGFLSINAAVAWLPWVVAGAYDLTHDIKLGTNRTLPRTIARAALPIAMLLLAGHAQTAWYTLVLGGLMASYFSWQSAYSHVRGQENEQVALVERIRSVAFGEIRYGAAAIFGAALAAVQLLPTAELLVQSQRAGGADYEFVMTYSYWPWRFITIFAPDFFGSPVSGDYWGYANYWEDAMYIGLLPVLLAIGAVLKNRKQPLVRFLAVLTIIIFVLALGKNTPIFPFLYTTIPTFDLFQAPTRLSIIAVFALSLLAAIGIESWKGPLGKRERRRGSLGLVISLGIVIAAIAGQFILAGREQTFFGPTILAGVLGAISAVLYMRRPKTERRLGWQWLIGGLIAIDLVAAGWGLTPVVSPAKISSLEKLELPQTGRIWMAEPVIREVMFNHLFRFDTFESDWDALVASRIPNLNIFSGVPSANNFDPLLPGRYVHWIEALENVDLPLREKMLAMMGVGTVGVLGPEAGEIQFQTVVDSPTRLHWFSCAVPANDGDQAWALTFGDPLFERPYVVLENFDTNAEWVCGDEGLTKMQVVEEGLNEIWIEVETETSGWLVVGDTWYPGWVATVEGEASPVKRANHLFQAVRVPTGGGEVVLNYRPVSFYIGAAISLLALLGLLWIYRWRVS